MRATEAEVPVAYVLTVVSCWVAEWAVLGRHGKETWRLRVAPARTSSATSVACDRF